MDPKAAEELAKNIQNVKNASLETTRAFQEQLKIITQMRDAMSQVAGNVRAMCQGECGVLDPETWQEVSKEVEKHNTEVSEAAAAAKRLAEVMKSTLAKAIIIATTALTGLTQGFKNVIAMSKAAGKAISTIGGGIFSIAQSILSIPFKIFEKLFDMANQGGGGNELAAAYQEVVKQFGDLKSGMGKAVVDTAKGLDKANKTGINTTQIFGNMAERVKAAKEMAEGLGPAFSVFEQEVEKGGSAMLIFNKALGISGEQMGSIASNAMRMGKSINDVHMSMTKQALGMEKAFKLNAKTLSKDMAKAMQDLSHFGHLSTKEMAVTAAFAQKMGVSIDKLVGVMDATSTFDQTAEGMSKLNQQFGTNIDFTEMMTAQSPEEKIALLSKEFARTGKDLSKLTSQERQLIKTSSGLTDEALNSMAAHGDMSDMLKDLNKQADKNEDKVMSQTQAMKELAKQIDKLTPSGGENKKTIFEQIIEGMTRGIKASPEFLQLMKNIRDVFRLALHFGFQLGKQIMKLLPGFGQVLTGFKELFDPARFKKMFDGILGAFKELEKGGPEASKRFFEKISASFKEFFTSGSGATEKIKEGFASIGKTLIKVVAGLGTFFMEGLAKLLPKITDGVIKFLSWIKNPKEIGLDKVKGDAPEWLRPITDMFGTFKTVLLPALKDAFDKIWPELEPLLLKAAPYVTGAIKAMLFAAFAPAMLNAVIGTASVFLGKQLFEGILHATNNAADKEVGTVAKKFSSFFKNSFAKVEGFLGKEFFGKSLGAILKGAGAVAAVVTAAVDVSDAMEKYTDILQKDGFSPAEAKMAAGTAGLINTLTLGLLPDSLQGTLARGVAEIYKMLFEQLDKWFGPGLSNSLKQAFSGLFDFIGGIGGLLKGMWQGDSKKVDEAFKQIGQGIVDFLIGAVKLAAVAIFQIGPLIFEYLDKAVAWLFGKLGNIFTSLENVPMFGPFFKAVGDFFYGIQEVFSKFAQAWKEIGDFFKQFDLAQWFSDTGKASSDFFSGVWQTITGWWNSVTELFGKVFDVITLPWRLAYNFVKTVVEAIYEEIISPVVDWISEKFDMIYEYVAGAFNSILADIKMMFNIVMEDVINPFVDFVISWGKKIFEWVTWPFKTAWTLIQGTFDVMKILFTSFVDIITLPFKTLYGVITSTFAYMWDTATGIVAKMIEWGNDLLKILTDPADKASLRLAKFFVYIWNGFKEIPTKLVEWGKGLFNSITTPFGDAWETIKKTFSWDNMKYVFLNIVESIKETLGKLADIGPFKALIDVAKKVFKIQSPSKVFADIGNNLAAGMDQSLSMIPANAEKTFDATIDKAEDMAKSMAKVSRTAIPDLNVDANMKPTAGGMGASGGYSIQGKDITINVNFNVTMDVDKVEKVIITRQQSVIRDRINFLMDNTMKGNSQTANALIKSVGEQSGNVAPNAAP